MTVEASWDISDWTLEGCGKYTDRIYVDSGRGRFHRVLTVTRVMCEDCGRMAVGIDRETALAALHSADGRAWWAMDQDDAL